MPVIKVKDNDHFDHMIENSKKQTIVAQFVTDWSGACREFADKYEEISDRYPNVSFITVNIDEDNHDLADNLNINSAPTFLFFEKGKLVPLNIVVTKPSQKHLNQAINKVLNGGGRARPDDRRRGGPNSPPGPKRRPHGGRHQPRDYDDDEHRYHKPSRRRPRDYHDGDHS